MSAFVDKVLLELSDPAKLKALVAQSSDPNRDFLKGLFSEVYDLPFATLHSVKGVEVADTELERPLFPPQRTVGSWMQTIPSHSRTEFSLEGSDGLTPAWLDCVADLRLTIVLEVDTGQVESILSRSIDEFTSVADFKAKFQFLDVDEFMASHKLTTVDDLREAFDYLLAEIKLKVPDPFDPNDPLNEHAFPLHVLFLVRDAVDMGGALRDVKLALAAIEKTVAYRRELADAEVLAPLAPVVVFPDNALPPGVTAAQLSNLFAGEGIQVLLVAP